MYEDRPLPYRWEEDDPLTGEERAGRMTYLLLARDGRYSTREVSIICRMTWEGARQMMHRLANVLPIGQVDGIWQRTDR